MEKPLGSQVMRTPWKAIALRLPLRVKSGRSLLTGLLLFSFAGVAFAAFSDIGSYVYRDAILELEQRGVVQGYSDGTYRPTAKINRAEFLKILIHSRPGIMKVPDTLQCFQDLVTATPAWYAEPVCIAKERGIVHGYPDGTFKPARNVNLVEALKMSLLSFGIDADPTGGVWYEQYIEEARRRGLLNHLLDQPSHLLTRGEMASLVVGLIHQTEGETPGTPAMCGNGKVEAPEQCDDGNVQDSDGCSSMCIIVPKPTRRAFLGIVQQTSGVATSSAGGKKNVALLRFTATGNRQDVFLNSVTFEPSTGSLFSGQNYVLTMDKNNDGIFETVVQSSGKVESSRLLFDSIRMPDGTGVRVPNGIQVQFQVSADLVPASGSVSLGLQFATSLTDYVQATGTDDGLPLTGIETNGSCIASNCFISVHTISTGTTTIVDMGNLYVSEDATPTRSHILLGGSITEPLLRLLFRADSEDIDVKKIRFEGIVSSVDSLQLYALSPGQTWSSNLYSFASASTGQCGSEGSTRMCADLPLGTLIINANSETTIVVTAKMKTDLLGAVSGQAMTITLSSAINAADQAVSARGRSSTRDLSQNDSDSTAEGEIFLGTSTIAANAEIQSETHDTALSSIGAVVRDGPETTMSVPVGTSNIGAFKISALTHSNNHQGSNDVVLSSITFRVSAQNVQLDSTSFKLLVKDIPDAQLTCTSGGSTGSFDVACSGLAGVIQHRITSGQSVTYALRANVIDSAINAGSTSTLVVEIPTLGQRSLTNSILWSDEVTNFTWVDVSETSVRGTVYKN